MDMSGELHDHGGMEARITKLEADVAAIKIDVAAMKIDIGVIKAIGATKSDIADVHTKIAEAKSAIIIWVAGLVFLAQLVPTIVRIIEKYI
ncbi:hypothetical protein CR152_22135 [Massilia violaceinigra]|uniref:DUF1640 domain-containing protein n=2 Tax=Massilia violaceinigra TaxID=2045208 RepID=A0A2D2DPM1_9BURK|nr:hypothetical protein CR152_22135 [Massilia violaceinigra]